MERATISSYMKVSHRNPCRSNHRRYGATEFSAERAGLNARTVRTFMRCHSLVIFLVDDAWEPI